MSVCRFLETGHLFRLRHATFRLPHQAASLHDDVRRVQASAARGVKDRRALQATAFLMGTHPRLGANSLLNTLPLLALKKIMQLGLQPCTLQLFHVDSGMLIELPGDDGS
ncbi:hypothetical protein ABBQ38_009715 [Trebouxia sp. C0009 RCD-2024]